MDPANNPLKKYTVIGVTLAVDYMYMNKNIVDHTADRAKS